MTSLLPTREQFDILTAVSGGTSNLLIRALAGTGKTSTLDLIEKAVDVKPILCLAFNKKIAETMEKRFLSTTTVRTLNGLGHRIWSKTCSGSITLDPKKSQSILAELIKDLKPRSLQQEAWDVYWPIIHAVAMAKSLGYVPDEVFPSARRLIDRDTFHQSLDEQPTEFAGELIDTVLALSIRQAYRGLIDYNDQIYMCALFGGTYPRFPFIMVDEAQDLSPTNHAMLDKLMHSGCRLIAVGDSFQSIYAFRGAQQGGMAEAQAKFRMTPMDLSVSFRCPRAVVEAARWRVPHFKWMKEGGHVERLQELLPDDIGEAATFICRNNAPLFRLGLQLLSMGRSISISGSEIGPKLIGIMRKLGPESSSRGQLLGLVDDWLAERLAKDSKSAPDLAACMKVFASHGTTLAQAITYAEHLFKQTGSIKLMTIHKAKGLEFNCVYFLDRWLCRDDEQDLNLQYVAQTRAKDKLFEIDSENIRWA